MFKLILIMTLFPSKRYMIRSFIQFSSKREFSLRYFIRLIIFQFLTQSLKIVIKNDLSLKLTSCFQAFFLPLIFFQSQSIIPLITMSLMPIVNYPNSFFGWQKLQNSFASISDSYNRHKYILVTTQSRKNLQVLMEYIIKLIKHSSNMNTLKNFVSENLNTLLYLPNRVSIKLNIKVLSDFLRHFKAILYAYNSQRNPTHPLVFPEESLVLAHDLPSNSLHAATQFFPQVPSLVESPLDNTCGPYYTSVIEWVLLR